MSYIYLDTAHLLKWHNKTLTESESIKLDHIFSLPQYRLVISNSHLKEAINRTDKQKIYDFFDFIKKIKCVYSPEGCEIFGFELLHAKNLYLKEETEIDFFEEIKEGFFSDEFVEQLVLAYDESQLARSSLDRILKTTTRLARFASKQFDKSQNKILVFESLKDRIKAEIAKHAIEIEQNIDDFINFILNNNLALSLKLNYLMTCQLNRERTKTISVNDWLDMEHLYSLPYVNYLSLDKEFCSRLKSIIKTHKLAINTKYDHILENLLKEITA